MLRVEVEVEKEEDEGPWAAIFIHVEFVPSRGKHTSDRDIQRFASIDDDQLYLLKHVEHSSNLLDSRRHLRTTFELPIKYALLQRRPR